jgi:hypothetical protein
MISCKGRKETRVYSLARPVRQEEDIKERKI